MSTVKTVKTINGLLIMASVAVVMSSCVLNEGDPNTTLCQKLTAHLMTAEKVKWNKAIVKPSEENLQITVGFNSSDGSTTEAVCTYGLNDRDEGEDYEVNPDKFVNLPDSMVINGQEVRLQDLQTSIQKVTGQGIKDTFTEENITEKANDAADVVKEGTIKIQKSAEAVAEQAKKAAVSATESLKEGAEQAKEAAGKVAEQLKETGADLQNKTGEVLEKAGEKLQE